MFDFLNLVNLFSQTIYHV